MTKFDTFSVFLPYFIFFVFFLFFCFFVCFFSPTEVCYNKITTAIIIPNTTIIHADTPTETAPPQIPW